MKISEESELEQEKESPESLRLELPPKKNGPGRPKKSAFTTTFVRKLFFYIFVLIDKLAQSDVQFEESEFDVMAGTWLSLQEKFAWMSTILNILGPLMMIGQTLVFIQRIQQGRAQKLAERQRHAAREETLRQSVG